MVAIDLVPTVGTRVVMCVLFFVWFTLYVIDRERVVFNYEFSTLLVPNVSTNTQWLIAAETNVSFVYKWCGL
jgi:hypothetical protein